MCCTHFAFQVHILSSERDTVMVIIDGMRMCGIYYFLLHIFILVILLTETHYLVKIRLVVMVISLCKSPMHICQWSVHISLYVSGYERIKNGLILKSNWMRGSALLFF